jgi:3-mercaptopyruvate sulfurtransferase SseA
MSLLVLYAPPVLADKHPFTNKPDWMIEPDWMLSHVNDEHLVIVDVREPDAFSLSHVPSAVNIPELR